MPIGRPWMRVPRQKLLTSAIGLSLNSYKVARIAAPSTVKASSNTQNFEVPRAFRGYGPDAPLDHSGEETEAETRCQNSDVAIIFSAILTVRLPTVILLVARTSLRFEAHNRTFALGPVSVRTVSVSAGCMAGCNPFVSSKLLSTADTRHTV